MTLPNAPFEVILKEAIEGGNLFSGKEYVPAGERMQVDKVVKTSSKEFTLFGNWSNGSKLSLTSHDNFAILCPWGTR